MLFSNKSEINLFDKQDTYPLRGLAMLLIIIHHLWQYGANNYQIDFHPLFALPFEYFGEWGVATFFLMSGYGLYKSLSVHTLDCHYIYVHFANLLLPYIYIFALSYIYIYGCVELTETPLTFVCLAVPGMSGFWFLQTILGVYLVVFLVYLLVKSPFKRLSVIIALTLVYILLARLFQLGMHRWVSILSFPMGMCFAYFHNLQQYVKKIQYLLPVMFLLLWLLSIYTTLGRGLPRMGCDFILPIILIIAVSKVSIRCSLLNFIGKNSLIFYLAHGAVMLYLHPHVDNFIIFCCTVAIITFMLSYIYSKYSIKIK